MLIQRAVPLKISQFQRNPLWKEYWYARTNGRIRRGGFCGVRLAGSRSCDLKEQRVASTQKNVADF